MDELDEKIARLRGDVPTVEYLAMNREETSIYCEFEDDEREAIAWVSKRRSMIAAYGLHVVKRETWRKYSSDIAAAYKLEAEIPEDQRIAYANELYKIISTVDYSECGLRWGLAHATPAQRCRAYLAWRETQNGKGK
jgi:hypothetical protein